MKIAVRLNEDKIVINTNNTNEKAAKEQAKKEGWTLVESDPAFSIETEYLWTVRESDGLLVHISTGMTPDEEKTQANALLGKNVGTALAAAQDANKKAENAVAGLAQFGKLVAPLLDTTRPSSNTDDGGTK
ncbi:hypothetical protein C5L30_000328 [Companilactobacillus farciminis]|uniref:Uncharacterized protein n=1 Tax=Companilactobacillus farciminis TaxID=1612 RepID=A0A4R5NJ52_9LACO|nr:hypothetical protein [Companilactobacillus farciminis]ATO46032.1 hypothetical protein LF20184_04345 [Companilactobacillus farciminis KCTC 3681 = DSM 20184]KRK61369.1 hypothetical protein FC68_GL001130 [Companilactobacillus farciminis KCTC 3681 = DSM 20184]TDG74612.1 hypothetical protein C5L30_000328 [Companilactobacillus farciminis]